MYNAGNMCFLRNNHKNVQRKNTQHNKPHIHAEYQGEETVIAFDGEILAGEGNIPKNKMKLIDAWMEIHKEDLYANWQLLSEGLNFFKIEPLR